MTTIDLPKLLYVGDVAVESTVAGSALIYRLLEQYPADRLQIIEGIASQPEKRLKNVDYKTIKVGNKRLLHSRLTPIYNSFLLSSSRQKYSQLIKIANEFQPEAILTVTHGFSWLIAAELAKHLNIPLHLLVHDDILALTPVPSWYRSQFNRQLQTVYRQARSRLCVSPYMVEAYTERYGVAGSVLYPCRSPAIAQFDLPPQPTSSDKPSKFAYAGSINTPGQAKTLISLALILQKFQSELIIYSSLTPHWAKQIGLDLPNVKLRLLVPSESLIDTLRQEANVLFAPMDFDEHYKTHVQLCFPSKLTDYTATGLPILIWGAAYSSAVRWAKENPGVAEVVDTPDIKTLEMAVQKLHQKREYCYQLGLNTLEIGHKYFGYDNVVSQFYKSISN